MPPIETDVTRHYTHGTLLDAIEAALQQIGIADPQTGDLAAIDEFHTGGRAASVHLIRQLGLRPGDAVLDIGCGIGGTARLLASEFGCRVCGIDVTPEFVAVADALTRRVGLAGQATFDLGDGIALPYANDSFDAATLLHVGMNVADKAGLCGEVARVLRTGGAFAIYDVMRTGEGDLDFPVPWSGGESTSFVAPAAVYRDALQSAGFRIEAEQDRRDFALDFFARMQARLRESGPPPPGVHLLMGADAGTKVGNLAAMISDRRLSPIELICRRA